MPEINVMIKPASSLCNMHCTYCFYSDEVEHREIASYGIMTDATLTAVLEKILAEATNICGITFQGGEPTIAGLDFFKKAVAIAHAKSSNSCTIQFALQTNGLLLDDQWCQFLKEHEFLVGLSMDGEAKNHNRHRVDASGEGTYDRVEAARMLLEKHGVAYNILWVLTKEQALYPRQAWEYICEKGLQYVQFIPCLEELEYTESQENALTPDGFAAFYNGIFPLWAEALRSGTYVSIKFFDDVFNLFSRRGITACGLTGQCQNQCIVEADGSVYPCDFYALDQWKMGNLTELKLTEINENPKVLEFLSRPRTNSDLCATCAFVKICGGGCPRLRASMYLNDTATFCGYRNFLETNKTQMEQILVEANLV